LSGFRDFHSLMQAETMEAEQSSLPTDEPLRPR
jgi:hypothetical protein